METKTKKKPEKEMSNLVGAGKSGKAISSRGRIFQGVVVSKHPKRIAIELERTVFIPKYERFSKKKTKIHARLPDELVDEVQIGNIVQVQQCRPLSKIIHFTFVKKVNTDKGEEK